MIIPITAKTPNKINTMKYTQERRMKRIVLTTRKKIAYTIHGTSSTGIPY
jgi:hypothetical protein